MERHSCPGALPSLEPALRHELRVRRGDLFRASPRSRASDREEGRRVPGARRPLRSASRSVRSSAPRTRGPPTSRCRSTSPMAHDRDIELEHNRAPRCSTVQV
jgi:hypothetical protein